MTSLEILRRTFRPISIPDSVPPPRGLVGVYMLVADDEIVYVGSSCGVESRIYQHAAEGLKDFDSAELVRLPPGVHAYYEGAFIRAIRPRYNRGAPRHCGYDNEILAGFGFPTHDDEYANAADWASEAARRRSVAPACDPDSAAARMSARIVRRREECGMSKADLARALGVTRQAVANWETGGSAVAVDRFEQLCTVLCTTPSEFWSDDPETVQ